MRAIHGMHDAVCRGMRPPARAMRTSVGLRRCENETDNRNRPTETATSSRWVMDAEVTFDVDEHTTIRRWYEQKSLSPRHVSSIKQFIKEKQVGMVEDDSRSGGR